MPPAYLIEENEVLQCLVAQSNKLINTLVKGIRDKPYTPKGDDAAMEEDGNDDDDDEIVDEEKIKFYLQGCEVYECIYMCAYDKEQALLQISFSNLINSYRAMYNRAYI